MKFFKHFVDAHRGKSIRQIRRSLGMAGIGMYWNLVEACAEKLEKRCDEEFTEEHCCFEFDLNYVAYILGSKPGRVEYILSTFQEANQLLFSTDNFIIRIEMPKLLESLDRDTKRARHGRGQAAPKIKIKIEDKDKEQTAPHTHGLKTKEEFRPNESFEVVYALYPNRINKQEGFRRLLDQRINGEGEGDLKKAVLNYKRYCELPWMNWYTPMHFDVWCGAKSKKIKPWRDWVSPDPSIFDEKKPNIQESKKLVL